MGVDKEFTLDFTGLSGVPSQWNMTINKVVQHLEKQSNGIHGIQVVKDQRRRGVFIVTAQSNEAKNFLTNFQLRVEEGHRKFDIPLRETNPAKNVWIKIHDVCRGDLNEVENKDFDKLFQELGATILVPTKRATHFKSTVLNGMREVRVELGDHIDRNLTWKFENGKEADFWVTYNTQPYHCRQCAIWHDDGNCPKREKNRNNWEKKEGQQKFLFFSSSMLRRAVDTDKARFDCIPGAKIGHIANHIDNDVSILPKAEVVVVWAGANMGGDSMTELKVTATAQSDMLAQALQPYKDDKDIFVVDPVCGIIPDGEEADEPRFLRAEMKRCATKAGASFIPLHQLDLEDDDFEDDDDVHLSKKGTKGVLDAIKTSVFEKTGKDILGSFKLADRAYAGVRLHYKVGCHRCTRLHQGRICPPYLQQHPATPHINGSDNSSSDGGTNGATTTISAAAAAATSSSSATPLPPTSDVSSSSSSSSSNNVLTKSQQKKLNQKEKRKQQQQQQQQQQQKLQQQQHLSPLPGSGIDQVSPPTPPQLTPELVKTIQGDAMRDLGASPAEVAATVDISDVNFDSLLQQPNFDESSQIPSDLIAAAKACEAADAAAAKAAADAAATAADDASRSSAVAVAAAEAAATASLAELRKKSFANVVSPTPATPATASSSAAAAAASTTPSGTANMAPIFATPTSVPVTLAVTPIMTTAGGVTSGAGRGRSTSTKRKNTSSIVATRDRSESQKKTKLSEDYFMEYAQNMNTLVSLGITQEKQKMMEKGLKGEDILKKQRAVIIECKKRIIAPKPGATAR